MLISSKVLNGINGIAEIPGDKSISHRSIIIPCITNGVSQITNILKSTDVMNTINAFKLMGVQIEEAKESITIYGKGLNSLSKPGLMLQKITTKEPNEEQIEIAFKALKVAFGDKYDSVKGKQFTADAI